MPRVHRISMGTSLFVHGLILLFLMDAEKPVSITATEQVPRLYMLGSKKQKKGSKKVKSKSRSNTKVSARKIKKPSEPKKWSPKEAYKKYQSLAPKAYDDKYYGAGGGASPSPFRGQWSDNPVMATLESMDLPELSENLYFFSALREKINQGTIYPRDLAEHKITGKIWIKILVDSKGRLLQVLSKSNKQPVLEAYVIVNIFEALKKAFPQKYWYSKEKDLAFSLHFDFSVSSVPNQKALHYARSEQNRMEFIRREKIPNLLEELASDYARYFPPIVPTPAGPVINFVQVYKMIQAWSELSPIERKKQRLRLTKEKINLMLEKTK